jgi:desampylase
MAMRISRPLLEAVLADARLTPDRERCGLLLGQGDRITAFHPAANVAGDPARHFEVDPAALLATHRAARAGGPALLGHYHFHPHGDVQPSPRDAAAAHGDGMVWLIVGMQHWASWRAVAGGSVLGAFEPAQLTLASA